MHIRRFSCDRQFIRETPSGSPRLGSRKWCSVDRHFLIRQFSYGRRGKKLLHECIAFKNHFFAHSGRPHLLEEFACNRRKILPGRQWPEELHKSKPADKLGPAGCQVKCQRGSPVVRYDEGIVRLTVERCHQTFPAAYSTNAHFRFSLLSSSLPRRDYQPLRLVIFSLRSELPR